MTINTPSLFIDPQLETEFRDNGFVVIPDFLTKDEVSEAFALFKKIHSSLPESGMWHTLFEQDNQLKVQTAEILQQICNRAIAKYFEPETHGRGYFMIKNTGEDSASKPHQDPSFIDYNTYNSGTVWIPLVDITAQNGNMYVWKGSHKEFCQPIAYFQPQAIENKYEEIKDKCTQIYMKAGDVLFFNHRVVHGSLPNFTDEIRPVIAYGIYPKATQLYYPFLKKRFWNKEIRFYKIDMNFFSQHDYKTEPIHLELDRVVKV
ncbi:MAG: phytanoyl-CoA dioxygenase family protein [Ignavibacteriales bacterium]|nr:phytanoyl-CoA dioxygenase family protein [Ignavibacteriales bacterium]